MRSLRGERPSPALLISVLALFVAFGGVAVAAKTVGTNSVDTKAIQKQAVKNSKVKKETLKGSRLREGTVSASKIKNGAIGDGKLDSAVKTRWAIVTSAGVLVRSRGVTAASLVPSTTGRYHVTFDRDITDCSWVATIGTGDSSSSSQGSIRTLLAPSTTNTVRVRTGDVSGTNMTRPFHLILHC